MIAANVSVFLTVIPAKAGIQRLSRPKSLDPGLRRDDGEAGHDLVIGSGSLVLMSLL
jgi:hypothetical protein